MIELYVRENLTTFIANILFYPNTGYHELKLTVF